MKRLARLALELLVITGGRGAIVIGLVVRALAEGRTVVWPLDGIGTGIARLREHSPLTFAHIETRLAALKGD